MVIIPAKTGLFLPVGTLSLSYGGPKLAFRRFLEFFVLAVTFLLFELARRLLKQKRAKKLFFILKFFSFSEILRFKRHTAVFVNFGTFFAGIFSPLQRSVQVPEAISGENLMFEQPPIIPATSLRRPSDPRNWPSKIFENFFSLFWP